MQRNLFPFTVLSELKMEDSAALWNLWSLFWLVWPLAVLRETPSCQETFGWTYVALLNCESEAYWDLKHWRIWNMRPLHSLTFLLLSLVVQVNLQVDINSVFGWNQSSPRQASTINQDAWKLSQRLSLISQVHIFCLYLYEVLNELIFRGWQPFAEFYSRKE